MKLLLENFVLLSIHEQNKSENFHLIEKLNVFLYQRVKILMSTSFIYHISFRQRGIENFMSTEICLINYECLWEHIVHVTNILENFLYSVNKVKVWSWSGAYERCSYIRQGSRHTCTDMQKSMIGGGYQY